MEQHRNIFCIFVYIFMNVSVQAETRYGISIPKPLISDYTMVYCGFETNDCEFTKPAWAAQSWIRSMLDYRYTTGPNSGVHNSEYYYLTKGNGYYRRNGDIAAMATQELPYTGTVCVQFYYYMYGKEVDKFFVYHNNKDVRNRFYEAVHRNILLTVRGDQGKKWIKQSLIINVEKGDNIVFAARVNGERDGDIAIDDISISYGLCSDLIGTCSVVVSAFVDAQISISAPLANFTLENHIIKGATSQSYEFSWDEVSVPNDGNVHQNSGIMVSSTTDLDAWRDEIKVEAVCKFRFSLEGDTMLVPPVKDYDTEFIIPMYKELDSTTGQIIIVASASETEIKIYRKKGPRQKYSIKKKVNLDMNDVYIYESKKDDLTGTFVQSTKPIAVYIITMCETCDQSFLAVPGIMSLDTEYFIPPIDGRDGPMGYDVKVTAAFDNTQVFSHALHPTEQSVLRRGEEIIITTFSLAGLYISCSEKCLVTIYNTAYESDKRDRSDSFVMRVPGMNHWESQVIFNTISGPENSYYITVLSKEPKQGYALNLVSNEPSESQMIEPINWGTIKSPKKDSYIFRTFNITSSYNHKFHTLNGDDPLGVWVYAHGNYKLPGDPRGFGMATTE